MAFREQDASDMQRICSLSREQPASRPGWQLFQRLSWSLPEEAREAIQQIREQAGSRKLGLLLISDQQAPEAFVLASLADWLSWYGASGLEEDGGDERPDSI